MSETYHLKALPFGSMIQEYRIKGVLGAGGFGIVYVAENTYLPEIVAIKEFLPNKLAQRIEGLTVSPASSDAKEVYKWGLSKFLNEARILWELGRPNPHPNIVRVSRFHEANGTAYMIMDFEKGEPLASILERERTLPEARLGAILYPLMDGLDKVHAKSVWHRDIKPANIIIRPDGSPVLIDFGAARWEVDGQAQSIMNAFTPDYAAPEQVYFKGQVGPWTDIYALGATLYRAVVGNAPPKPSQTSLGVDDEFASRARAQGYSQSLLLGIDAALEPNPDARPQDIAQWRECFEGGVDAFSASVPSASERTRVRPAPAPSAGRQSPVDTDRTRLSSAGTPKVSDQSSRKLEQGTSRHSRTSRFAAAALIVIVLVATGYFYLSTTSERWTSWKVLYTRLLGGDEASPSTAMPELDTVAKIGPAQPVSPSEPDPTATVEPAQPTPPSMSEYVAKLESSPEPTVKESAEPLAPTGVNQEIEFWSSVKASTNPAYFREYLYRYGEDGKFSGLARLRIEELRAGTRTQAPENPVSELLKLAAADVADLRLTNPEGNNAVQKIEEVLALEPGNAQAKRLRSEVVVQYVGLAEGALAAGDVAKAKEFIDRGGRVDASSEGIEAMRERIAFVETRLREEAAARAETKRKDEAAARAEAEQKQEEVHKREVLAMAKRQSALVPAMVTIQGDCYEMGSPSSEGDRYGNERQHEVCVDDFAIGKYEVTFEEYDRFALATGRTLPKDRGWGRGRYPVINVSWEDAVAYVEWLSRETGRRYRLPTEAEWEYAARAGNRTAYPWGDDVGLGHANCNGCGSGWDNSQAAPVGSFEPNAWGLHDTAGNVWEWTCSEHHRGYGDSETQCASRSSSADRSVRGGSWFVKPRTVRSAMRTGDSPTLRSGDTGFRLVQK